MDGWNKDDDRSLILSCCLSPRKPDVLYLVWADEIWDCAAVKSLCYPSLCEKELEHKTVKSVKYGVGTGGPGTLRKCVAETFHY